MDLNGLIKFAVDNGASDIHLQAAAAPIVRIGGTLTTVAKEPVSNEQMAELIAAMVPSHLKGNVAKLAVEGLDFSYRAPAGARFRCSAYSALGQLGMTMRLIRAAIPTLEELHLPHVIADIALAQRGLTLVTGTTGSGKSTTLAAMIDLINTHYDVKVITIEDPVEYIHPGKRALISQLEVGGDTPSFDQAMRQALRQDPNVILVGELRDVETLRMALRAADTGHQVFATVHSARAAQTIERIIAMFPPNEQKLLLSQLSHTLEAIISQRLVVTREDGKRRPAVEILRGGPITERYILEGRLNELSAHIETGESGMQTFDQHLLAMYRERIITGTEALRHANRPEALATAMRGIRYTGAGPAARGVAAAAAV